MITLMIVLYIILYLIIGFILVNYTNTKNRTNIQTRIAILLFWIVLIIWYGIEEVIVKGNKL